MGIHVPNLALLLKSQIADLWGTRKNRIRAVLWVGGGADLLESELKGFHFHEVFADEAQWKNAQGCLIAMTESDTFQPHSGPVESTQRPASESRTVLTPVPNPSGAVSQTFTPTTESEPVHRTPERVSENSVPRAAPSQEPTASPSTAAAPVASASAIPRRFQEGRGAWS